MPRLPQIGGDEGTWGSILNDFLSQAHNSDGTLKGATNSRTGGIRLSNDIGGSATSPTVTGLRNRNVSSSTPTDGQILAWNNASSQWEPTTGAGGSLTLEQVHDDLGNTSLIAGTGMTKTYNDGANTITLDLDEPFTGADRTKLDGIEAGATQDQTPGEIKTAYESNANTNAFTDTEQTKLAGIEAGADVTDETNVKSALDGMALSDVGTPAATDRILLQDASDSNNFKYADFSEFGGGGGSGNFLAFKVAASNAPATVQAVADYVCDGTDDDVEIQAALDAANNYSETTDIAGATVYLSEGDYYLTSALELGVDGPDDYVSVSVRGQGAASTILHGNAKGHHGFVIRQSSDAQHISGLRMEDFDHAVARPSAGPFGIEDYFLFHDCYLYNNNYGIVVQNSQYRIRDCVFEANINYGVWLYYASHSSVSDCQFYYNGDGDILCTEMESVKLTDNVTEGPDAHIRIEGYIYGGVISGVTMNYSGDQGIVIDNGNGGINGLVISGCNLSGYPSLNVTSTAAASSFAGGLVVSGNNLNDGNAIIDAPNLLITGNQIPAGIEFGANATGVATANDFGNSDHATPATSLVDNSGGGMDFGSGNFVYGNWQTAGGVSQLDDLSDVDTSGKTDGQVLTWNNTASQWEATTVSGGGGGNKISYMVAASDAPAETKSLSDYVCTGTNDQTVIQQAIDDFETYRDASFGITGQYPYLEIKLSGGTFYFGSHVDISAISNCHIRGEGQNATRIRNSGSSNAFFTASGLNGTAFSNLYLYQFTQAFNLQGSSSGLKFNDIVFQGTANSTAFDGIYIENAVYVSITDCTFYGQGTALSFDFIADLVISDNQFYSSGFSSSGEDITFGSEVGRATINNNLSYSSVRFINSPAYYVNNLIVSSNQLDSVGPVSGSDAINFTGDGSTNIYGLEIANNHVTDDIIIDGFDVSEDGLHPPVVITDNWVHGSMTVNYPCTITGNYLVNGLIIGSDVAGRALVSNNFLGDSVAFGGAPTQTLTDNSIGSIVDTGAGNYEDGTWVSNLGGGGSSNATQIQSRNVSAAAPSDGQSLTWNNSTSQWEPQAAAASVSSGWNLESNFPEGEVAEQSMAAFGNDLYVIGGYYDTPGDYSNKTYRYNTLTDTWTELAATLPFLAGEGAAVSDGTYIYYIGDYGDAQQNSTLRLDPTNPIAWTAMATMPETRNTHAIAYINGNIYVTGGYPGGVYTEQTIWGYNIAGNTWSDTLTDAPANYIIEGHAGAAYNDLFYTFGYDANTEAPLAYYYDPVGDSWTQIANPPLSLFFPTTAVVGTEIWLMSGYNVVTSEPSNVVAAYDPATNEWRSIPATPNDGGGDYGASAAIGSTAYTMGGYNNTTSGMTDRLYSSGAASVSLSDLSDVAIINSDDPGTVLTVNEIGVWEAKSPLQEVVFSQAGALTASTSPRYITKRKQTLKKVVASLDTSGSSNTVINVLRGATTIGTITITSGSNYAEINLSQTFYDNPSFYYLRMQVATVGTGAQNLTVQARFE